MSLIEVQGCSKLQLTVIYLHHMRGEEGKVVRQTT